MIKSNTCKRKLMVILFCVIFVLVLSACNLSRHSDNQEALGGTTSNNSDQVYSFVIPKSLFGGGTAEAVIDDYTNPNNTFLLKSGEEIPVYEMISDAELNEDGTVTCFFTADQLERFRLFLYDTASLDAYINSEERTAIKRTEFSNDDLTDIVVYVDSDTYENSGRDGIFANVYATTYMGLYQVMSGVDPYEWKVHVTVKDYKTNGIVTEDYYPTDR